LPNELQNESTTALARRTNLEFNMAKGNNSQKKEVKKPKKEKPKAAPVRKGF
jgi:hypothetical protein